MKFSTTEKYCLISATVSLIIDAAVAVIASRVVYPDYTNIESRCILYFGTAFISMLLTNIKVKRQLKRIETYEKQTKMQEEFEKEALKLFKEFEKEIENYVNSVNKDNDKDNNSNNETENDSKEEKEQ